MVKINLLPGSTALDRYQSVLSKKVVVLALVPVLLLMIFAHWNLDKALRGVQKNISIEEEALSRQTQQLASAADTNPSKTDESIPDLATLLTEQEQVLAQLKKLTLRQPDSILAKHLIFENPSLVMKGVVPQLKTLLEFAGHWPQGKMVEIKQQGEELSFKFRFMGAVDD